MFEGRDIFQISKILLIKVKNADDDYFYGYSYVSRSPSLSFQDHLSIIQDRKFHYIESIEMFGCRRACCRKAENDFVFFNMIVPCGELYSDYIDSNSPT